MAIDEVAARVEAGVAVAAPHAKREQPAGAGRLENSRDLVVPCGLVHIAMRDSRVAAPGKDAFGGSRSWLTHSLRSSGRGAQIRSNFTSDSITCTDAPAQVALSILRRSRS